jgi:hypothetical protein
VCTLTKSADDLPLKAESATSAKSIRELITKSNSFRKSAQEKLSECKFLEGTLDTKLAQLKNE